jgi:thioredoxin 1
MNKTTQIIIGLIAIIVVGGGIFSFANQASQKTAETKKTADTAMMKKEEDAKMAMKKEDEKMAMKKKEEEAAMKKDPITGEVMKKDEPTTTTEPATAPAANNGTTNSNTGSTPTPSTNTAPQPAPVVTKVDGNYTAYNSGLLASADKSPTVIFFHASWCPTCKAAEADINKNLDALKASGVQILKTDYDTSTELKKQYGVTSQSTFVKVDSKGAQIKKGQGFTTLDAITNFAK